MFKWDVHRLLQHKEAAQTFDLCSNISPKDEFLQTPPSLALPLQPASTKINL